MSDTLISQQLTLTMMPDNQLSQMNPAVSRAELTMANILEGSVESMSAIPTTDHLSLSSMEHHQPDCNPTFSMSSFQEIWESNNLNRQSESTPNNMCMQQCPMTSRETGQMPLMKSDSVVPNLSMSNKRKATTELIPDNRVAEKMLTPNRRVSEVGSITKGSGSMGVPMSNSAMAGRSGKKVAHLESVKNKPQLSTSKKNAQTQAPSKTSADSNDSVRAKLRESLASALALVSQERECSSDGKLKADKEAKPTVKTGGGKQYLISASSNTANLESGKSEEPCGSSIPCPTDRCNDVNNASQGVYSKELCEDPTPTWNYMGTSFQSNPVLSDMPFGDSFFFRDELLHGNGLTWAMELQHDPEEKKAEHVEESDMLSQQMGSPETEQPTQCPEAVAFNIEAELFKLFGGVNKKYKEKGRSLLFNLKDRNNPELRERVMSAEITPDRLCSMTAEELASKELSQWRIAKAEELDHMKVLPDTEANMRRLVKKTHKGEYTVDLDPSFDSVEEIPSGTSAPIQNRSRTKSTHAGASRKAEQTKKVQDECEITIPCDGADMQGLMVDDVKDLPPIVSLDEFMESLDKEPPFDNLQVPGGTSHELNKDNIFGGPSHESKKEALELCCESVSPVKAPEHHAERTPNKTEDMIVDSTKQIVCVKSTDSHQKVSDSQTVVHDSTHDSKVDLVWEGFLQINLSSTAIFVALHLSGEKANTKDWPSFFEIKGRVKLDAFDKFVQALPMSRSRAIMVTHFVLKEGSTESDRANLVEVVDSYIMDQKLGFAEPTTGVELYLCPPHSKSVDVIISHLPNSYTEKLKEIDNGLIGLLVWRKVQITPAISHNSCFHNKDLTKKNPFSTSGGDQSAETNMSKRNYRHDPPPPPPFLTKPQLVDGGDDDDDVPPGFGPMGHTRDDDDLPEFNFPGSSELPASRLVNLNLISGWETSACRLHPHPRASPAQQVEQMRELIHKYGQNRNNVSNGESRITIQPWDDDDDIPDWQPQAPVTAQLPPPHNPSLPNPGLPPQEQFPSQQQLWARPLVPPMQPLQPPMRVPQQGTWWPYGSPNSVGSGNFYGTPGDGHQDTRDRGRPNNNHNSNNSWGF